MNVRELITELERLKKIEEQFNSLSVKTSVSEFLSYKVEEGNSLSDLLKDVERDTYIQLLKRHKSVREVSKIMNEYNRE